MTYRIESRVYSNGDHSYVRDYVGLRLGIDVPGAEDSALVQSPSAA